MVQQPAHSYYTTQFAGDMQARFAGETMTLLQAWSPDDFQRMQENLIGHLVVQKRLKLSPTLFIATLDSELDVISVCNVSGEVLKETLGTRKVRPFLPPWRVFSTSSSRLCNPLCRSVCERSLTRPVRDRHHLSHFSTI
ncbi:SecY interacting protein Syd [Raoultella terrigena]|uniref:SecY interacting protein Syd n=1 Tax=Raoultella terrigena TaxID=577 RepID=A0A4U9D6C2_RAOTE|nr:SecY interacting protein Syd [Raoultella terrigena]